MKLFAKEAISSIKNIGAIAPSSKYLANNIVKHMVFEENQVILEFGPGDGAITKFVLKQLPKNSRLISLEINDSFFQHCNDTFGSYSNFEVYNHSAFEFDKLLKQLNVKKIDYLISSLPLSIFAESDLDVLFRKIPQYLNEKGQFFQYQYTLGKHKFLKSIFEDVTVGFTFSNLPPAFIYRCR